MHEVTDYCQYHKCENPATYLPNIDNGRHNDFCSEECAEKDYELYLDEIRQNMDWPDRYDD